MNTIRLNTLGEAKAASSGDIKNQDKSVEIVENGVTEVTADSGYTGLGKVTINANVQGGESGGGKRLLFYDIKDLDVPTKRVYMGWAAIINGELTTGAKVIEIGAAFCMRFSDSHNYAHKVCIDLDGPLWLDGNHETVEESIKRTVGSLETLDQYATKITKEQFYTI